MKPLDVCMIAVFAGAALILGVCLRLVWMTLNDLFSEKKNPGDLPDEAFIPPPSAFDRVKRSPFAKKPFRCPRCDVLLAFSPIDLALIKSFGGSDHAIVCCNCETPLYFTLAPFTDYEMPPLYEVTGVRRADVFTASESKQK